MSGRGVKPALIILLFSSILIGQTSNMVDLDPYIYLGQTTLDLFSNFKGAHLTNLKNSKRSYSEYLREAFENVPYDKAYYLSGLVYDQPANMVFLIHRDQVFMVSFQAVLPYGEFARMKLDHINQHGIPAKTIEQESLSEKHLWELPTKNQEIFMNYALKPLGYTLNDMTTLTPFPEFAFSRIEGLSIANSIEMWKRLREEGVINEYGILLPDYVTDDFTELDQVLNTFNLSPKAHELAKIMLISTHFGELNVVYISRPLLEKALDLKL